MTQADIFHLISLEAVDYSDDPSLEAETTRQGNFRPGRPLELT